MEKTDIELLEKHAKDNNELDRLHKEHLRLETEIEKLLSIKIMSPTETQRLKKLKRQKLEGRDRMEQIFKTLRNA